MPTENHMGNQRTQADIVFKLFTGHVHSIEYCLTIFYLIKALSLGRHQGK